jgi:small subunit ribosomal protein S20
MANIKSSKKRIKVIETKTAKNKRVKIRLKEILKKFDVAIEAGDKETALELLNTAEKKLMQAAAKGTLHKKTASRKVSRLTKRFAKEFGADALKEKPESKKASTPKATKKTEDKPSESKEVEAVEAKEVDEKADAKPKKKSTKKESAEEAEATEEPKTEE